MAGLADTGVEELGHTTWPRPTPATTATTTATEARAISRPFPGLVGAAGATGAPAGGHPRYVGAPPTVGAAPQAGGAQVPAGGVGGPWPVRGSGPVWS